MPYQCEFFATRLEAETGSPSTRDKPAVEKIVPLIPLDQLPPWIQDGLNVQKDLSIRDTKHMTNAGELPPIKKMLECRLPRSKSGDSGGSSTPPVRHIPLDSPGKLADGLKEIGSRIGAARGSHTSTRESGSPGSTAGPTTQHFEGRPLRSPRSPAGTDLEHSHSKYCQKYCHHGPTGPLACPKGPENCPSLHEMPHDRAGLQSVGLERIPSWHPDSAIRAGPSNDKSYWKPQVRVQRPDRDSRVRSFTDQAMRRTFGRPPPFNIAYRARERWQAATCVPAEVVGRPPVASPMRPRFEVPDREPRTYEQHVAQQLAEQAAASGQRQHEEMQAEVGRDKRGEDASLIDMLS